MKNSYRGTDKTVEFVSARESNHPEVGVKKQEINGINDGKRIDFELCFCEPFEPVSVACITTKAISENRIKVRWGFDGHIDYQLNSMLITLNLKHTLKNDFYIAFINLKVC